MSSLLRTTQFILLGLSFFFFGALPSNALAEPLNTDPLTASVILKSDRVEIGGKAEILIKVELDPHFHAYVDRFQVHAATPEGVLVSNLRVAPTVNFFDKVSKNWREGVYHASEIRADLAIPLEVPTGPQNFRLNLTYQACAEEFCLLPKTIPLELRLELAANERQQASSFGPAWLRSQSFEQALKQGTWSIFILMFFAGLLTSLTPCIFPMIPITLSIIGTRSLGQTRVRSFLLSLAYVFGIALTYSVLGVFAARTGRIFGAALSSPAVVLFIAGVFVVMGLSMYGLFELQMPAFIRNRLMKSRTGSGFGGAFISGLIAGVVASPCVGPVLVGVLTFVAQSQNSLMGFFLLFAFALGMGILFIVLGTFSSLLNHLPKAGAWMNAVKFVFGTIMMIMAIWYVKPLLNLKSREPAPISEVKRAEKRPTDWVNYSEGAFDQGLQLHKPIVIDFYADWCGACKELDETFSERTVSSAMKDFTLLRFDATSESDLFNKLKTKYGIVGLPMVVFYGGDGKQRTDLTLTGYESPTEFLTRIHKLKSPKP